jgi:hypothetical protein
MTPLEALIKNIDEKVIQLREFLSTGRAETYEEYKRMCGEIRGLLSARDYAVDLKTTLENMDD